MLYSTADRHRPTAGPGRAWACDDDVVCVLGGVFRGNEKEIRSGRVLVIAGELNYGCQCSGLTGGRDVDNKSTARDE